MRSETGSISNASILTSIRSVVRMDRRDQSSLRYILGTPFDLRKYQVGGHVQVYV